VKVFNFCGSRSTLKKKLEVEANSEAFNFLRSGKRKHFIKTWGRNVEWKRLNFCGSGSTLKKEAGSGSKL